MGKYKVLAIFIVIYFVFNVAIIDCVMAGEKVKSSATSVRTKWHPIEVNDEEGHIIAVYENKNVYLSDESAESVTGISKGLIDMNVKTGKGTIKGYVVSTYPNGDKLHTRTEGQLIGERQAKGTFVYISGTGNLEGVKGSGVWQSKSLAPGISLIEIDGERMLPGK
jgi:hypothetical protein